MPKVELHVHLEGAIQPHTLLELARRNHSGLPASTVDELRAWYTFRDFQDFGRVYMGVSACLCTPDDIEMVTREFLAAQSAQNILYSEVTYTALTQYYMKGLAFREQLAAINRARAWAEGEHGVTMRVIVDIPRPMSEDDGLMIADWAIRGMGDGVVALGLAGPETFAGAKFGPAFERARTAGLPAVIHAGEHGGAESIREALEVLGAVRVGHGVRCLEDGELVETLRRRQMPLEVCPTSNVRLGIAASVAAHPLPRLLEAGLYVTINSDDPALFGTTLTEEYLAVARAFRLGPDDLQQLVLNAVRATLLPAGERAALEQRCRDAFARLRGAPASDPADRAPSQKT